MDYTIELRRDVTVFAEKLDLPPIVNAVNEHVNRQAWEQAAEAEKQAAQTIADMWAIIQKVATEDSTRWWGSSWDSKECPFCDGMSSFPSLDVEHDADCVVTKARTLVKPEAGG